MDREIIPVGLDFGNGFIKICSGGKTSKIPAVYSLDEPEGAVSAKTGLTLNAKTFHLSINDNVLWFGEDVLGSAPIREIDAHKYQKLHIRMLFAAAMANHVTRHKIDVSSTLKLRIVASMPPGRYQDAPARKEAEKIYRSAFNSNRKPWYIKSSLCDTFRIATEFGGLTAEASSYVRANQLKTGLTVIADIGYGTVDFVLMRNGATDPLLVKSFNTGLVHRFQTINEIDHNQAELALLRKSQDVSALVAHFNDVKNKLALILRHVGSGSVNIVVIGGGVKLMSKSVKASFKTLSPSIVFKDEYTNAVSNAALASAL